jgi:hypothetical protein
MHQQAAAAVANPSHKCNAHKHKQPAGAVARSNPFPAMHTSTSNLLLPWKMKPILAMHVSTKQPAAAVVRSNPFPAMYTSTKNLLLLWQIQTILALHTSTNNLLLLWPDGTLAYIA